MFYYRFTFITSLSTLLIVPILSFCTPTEASTVRSFVAVTEQFSEKALRSIAQSITVKVFAANSGGSGVLIARKGQLYTVLTNAHVITAGEPYRIQTPDGKVHQTTLLNKGDSLDGDDLAVLQFRADEDYTVGAMREAPRSQRIATRSDLAEKQQVFAAGFSSETQSLLFTGGEISLLPDKPLRGGYQIGITNKIQSGMSGGPILNREGEVIGVSGLSRFAILEDAYRFQDGSRPTSEQLEEIRSLSWGVPIETITRVSPQLASILPGKNNPGTLTGVAATVDEIASKISVRIDSANSGNGSGVIIAHQGNTYYVLTAAHVVENPEKYRLVTYDGQEYGINSATVKILEGADLAVLQFQTSRTYPVPTLAKYSLGVQERITVFLSGFPEVKENSSGQPKRRLTAGGLFSKEQGLSSLKDLYSLPPDSGYELVYTNISSGGMSGGAVLDSKGRLIGIHAAAEGEVTIEESGQVEEVHLGRSLGVPIATFLSLAEKANINPDLLKVETDKPATLKESEIKSIEENLQQVQAPPENATEVDWLNYGNQLWRVERYEEAVAAFNKAIALKPDFYQAYYARGLAFSAQDKHQQAFESFKKATDINPRFYQAWRQRSNSLYDLEKYEQALADIDRAIALQPEDWILYNNRASILLELLRYQDAIAASDRSIELNPEHSQAYLNRNFGNYFLKKYDLALKDVNKALSLNPIYPLVYYWRGQIYDNLKEYDKAISNFNRALELDPKFYFSYYGRSSVYQDLEQYDRAISELDRGLKINPEDTNLYISRGLIYIQLTEFNKAIADFSKAIALDPKNADAYRTRCSIYGQSKIQQYKKAIADCTRALEITPDNATAYIYKEAGMNPVQNLNVGDAHRFFSYTNRAFAYFFLGERDKAIADFTEALKINPQDANTYEPRGIVYMLNGQYQKALADFSKALEILPEDASLYENRGQVYNALKEYDKAIADFDRALQINPDSGVAYKERGRVQVNLQEYNKAIADLNKAIEINPKDGNAYVLRGVSYAELGEQDKALADCQVALQINPKDAVAYFGRGFTHFRASQYNEAIRNYDRALQLNPKYAEVYVAKGNVYQATGDYEKALAQYNQALRINEKLPTAYGAIGLVKYETGDKQAALSQWQKSLSIDSKQPETQMAIAVALYTEGDRELGIGIAQTALKSKPRLADINYLKKNLWGDTLIADTQKLLENSKIRATISQNQRNKTKLIP